MTHRTRWRQSCKSATFPTDCGLLATARPNSRLLDASESRRGSFWSSGSSVSVYECDELTFALNEKPTGVAGC